MYLSIDLDFWNAYPGIGIIKHPVQVIKNMVALCKEQDVQVRACMNHQQMLPWVNASNARTLVNIDFHSDVCEPDATELNCGTWITYVKWRKVGTYIWLRSQENPYDGACNTRRVQYQPSSWKHGLDWKRVSSREVFPTTTCLMSKINKLLETHLLKGVGICLSPQYTYTPVLEAGRELIKQLEIPYQKGRANENYGRRCAPPKIFVEF